MNYLFVAEQIHHDNENDWIFDYWVNKIDSHQQNPNTTIFTNPKFSIEAPLVSQFLLNLLTN